MLTFPTILEAAAITPVGIFRAQLLGTTPVFGLVPTTALLGEDLHRVADSVFLCSHYDVAAVDAASSCKYFKYKGYSESPGDGMFIPRSQL